MSAEELLFAALTADAGVTALVGTRIYPELVPQEQEPPCVAYSRAGTEYVMTIHSGVPAAQIATLEIVCMARTQEAANQVADAVVPAAGAANFVLTGRSSMPPDVDLNGMHGTTLTVTKFT